MKLTRCFLVLFTILNLFHNIGIGQNLPIRVETPSNQYSLYQWTTENGLPQNNIRQIIESDEGFLWLATFNGLVRFDGYEFRTFDESNITGLSSSFILNMAKDSSGTIWVATENEIIKIENNIPQLYLKDIGRNVQFKNTNSGIYAIAGENLYRLEENVWVKSLNLIENRPYQPISYKDELLLLSDDSLFSIKENRLDFKFYKNKLKSLNDGIFSSNNGSNTSYYNYENETLVEIEPNTQFDWYKGQENKDIKSIYHDKNQTTVLTYQDQIVIYINGTKQTFSNNTNLNLGRIEDISISSSGVIWIGTNSTGLFMLYPKIFSNAVDVYHTDNKSGFMVYQSQDSIIWFDQKCDEMLRIKPDNSIESVQTNTCLWTMTEDKFGNLWLGGDNTGVHKLNRKTNRVQFLPFSDDVNGKITFSLFTSASGQVYLGTNEGTFLLENDEFHLIEGSKSLGKIFSFYEDRDHHILACTNEGIVHFKENQINQIFTREKGLPTDDIRSIYQDEDRNYWIGTSQYGLCFFDGFGLVQLPTNDGRLNKNVWCIIEDDMGYFWMNSNQGIYRVSRKELIAYVNNQSPGFSSQHYTSADGLANSEGNSRTQNKGFKSYDGKIWFSMISGPACVDPMKIKGLTNENKIVIDNVLIDNKRVSIDEPIVVGPDQNQIQFEFSHPNFYQTQHLRYLYKIEGLDERWFDVGKSRLMTFSELPLGNYKLRIKQVGTEAEATIDFEVEVHFWEKDSFKHTLVFATTALIFFIIFSIWRGRRYGRAQIKKMSGELKSLELRALQSQMNPHFVFNCLSSIQSLYLLGESERANEYLSQFSRLLRIILEHAQKRLISLKEDLDMFKIYVPLEGLQFDEPFEFELTVDENVNTETLFIPSMVTHTFIENAIKHGIKPLKNRKGSLKINVSKTETQVVLRIQDNGIGYEKSLATKTANKRTHKSRGIDITNQRIDILNLLNDLDIQVETNNLKNSKGESKGTEIILYFPIIEDYEDFNR